MPFSPAHTPCPPSTPCSPPICSSSPNLSPQRAVLLPPAHFDWAKDAESLPIPLPAAPAPPRDLSGLRSNLPGPFRSLRRRVRRRSPPQFFLPSLQFFSSTRPSFVQPPVFITRRHPSGIGPGKPIITVPSGTPTPVSSDLKLKWDCDPRLVNLGQALRALGWIPPC
jgi:hypothetical protein